MTFAPDTLIRDTVRDALTALRKRPELLDTIFRGSSSATRTEMKGYFTEADRIAIRLGWTQTATDMPCIAITLPGEQESEQYIGSDAGDTWDDDGTVDSRSSDLDADGVFTSHEVTQFAGSVDAVVYARNAEETTWLVSVVKWALLRGRRQLEAAGLDEQRLRLTDFMPASEYPQPDVCYTRAVQLSYTTCVTYDLADPDESIVLPIDAVDARNTNEQW